MANNFQITISAVDKATKTVRNVNNSLSRLNRPVTNLRRSFGQFGAEVARNPAAKAVAGIGRAAAGAAASVARIAAPMAALTGVASIAGIAMLATEWGRLGFEISKTGQSLGVTTTDLQSLRGAAQMAGIATEALDGSLRTLGDTLQDSLYGRNQNAMILLNKLGISIRRTADGSIDTVKAFKDMANWVAKTGSVQQQNLVARAFGLEAALPLLRKGAAGIEEYQRKVAEFGGVSTKAGIKAAEDFGLNLNYLKAAGYGLKISIGSALLPAMQKLTLMFTGLITTNREAIASKIGEWAERFAKWVDGGGLNKTIDDLGRFGRTVGWVAEKIITLVEGLQKLEQWGGKLNALPTNPAGMATDLYGRFFGGNTAGSGQSASGTIKYNGAPLGIRTNNPLNIQPGGRQGVYGSTEEGLRAGIGNVLRNYQGLTLAQYVRKYAPGNGAGNTPASEAGYLAHLSRATGIAPNQVPNLNDPKVLAPLISAQVQHENGGKGYDKAAMDQAIGKVVVEFQNAPPGTRAVARANNGTEMPVKINHTMQTMDAG